MTPETSVYEYAKQGVLRSPNKTALWFYRRSVSFSELFSRIDYTAEYLNALGVGDGTVVTIHLPNCPHAIIAFYAIAKLGAICNMVHAQMPVNGVRELMDLAQSEILITYQPECVGISKRVICVEILSAGDVPGTVHCPSLSLESVFSGSDCEESLLPKQRTLAQKCVVYLHSSGSTGRPKTIMLSHSALNHCVEATADFFEDEVDRYVSLGVLPLFHGFGLAMDVHRNISFGSTLVQMLKWNSDLAVQLIKEHQVSLMVGVPTMYYSLLNNPGFYGHEINCLKKCYVGGDNVPPELIYEFDQRVGGGHRMFVGYGLTEATTTDFVNTYRYYKESSSGYPTRGTTAAVMNESGEIAYCGEGELIISNKTLMMGYLNDVSATENTLIYVDGKQWTRTGDFVFLDKDGFLFFKDRIKNIIIHNGYNIYPAHLEDVIGSVPGVEDVCVVGVTDQKLRTQNVRAVVIAAEGISTEELEKVIIEKCYEMLPKYSVPKEIVFVTTFPQNSMGKVDRIKLGNTT